VEPAEEDYLWILLSSVLMTPGNLLKNQAFIVL
jgi:hypothetical protein